MRICPKCSLEQPLDNFIRYYRKGETRYSICRKCHNERQAKWVKNHPEAWKATTKKHYKQSARNKDLKAAYGITEAEYDLMLEGQGGKCANSGCDRLPGEKAFHVDHDHSTGAIRGILCGPCNRALGFLKDSYEAVCGLKSYLEKSRQDPALIP